MQASTYGDLIEGKIAEWEQQIAEIEKRALKAGPELVAKVAILRTKVDTTARELKTLDGKENVANTVEIKDKILELFHAIDEDLQAFGEVSPFML